MLQRIPIFDYKIMYKIREFYLGGGVYPNVSMNGNMAISEHLNT